MRYYIAGPISKDPNYKAKFEAVEERLLEEGGVVLSPAVLPSGLTQAQYMSICIPMLYCCDCIYLLEGWENSVGARIEGDTGVLTYNKGGCII